MTAPLPVRFGTPKAPVVLHLVVYVADAVEGPLADLHYETVEFATTKGNGAWRQRAEYVAALRARARADGYRAVYGGEGPDGPDGYVVSIEP